MATTSRLSRDEYGRSLARTVAGRAACTRRQVGAVILDRNHRVVATGYNGVASGLLHCDEGGCPRGADPTIPVLPVSMGNGWAGRPKCVALHAEINAILWAEKQGVDLSNGCTIYITTAPCPDCLDLCLKFGLEIVHD